MRPKGRAQEGRVVITKVYSGKTAAELAGSAFEKVYLTVAPIFTGAGNGSSKRYDWQKKKVFSLSRDEVYAILAVMNEALTRGPAEAKALCTKFIGADKTNLMFIHKKEGHTVAGGLEFNDQTDAKYAHMAPFLFKVVYYGEGRGEQEALSCPMPRMRAFAIAKDLSLYLAESMKLAMATDRWGSDPKGPTGRTATRALPPKADPPEEHSGFSDFEAF
jgi:hypothetical protein